MNRNKHIWEGWTVGMFIDDLEPMFNMIMAGDSWRKPFLTKNEIVDWCKDNQSYYKKRIKEVENYFITKAGLK